jgi:hypothetical protein
MENKCKTVAVKAIIAEAQESGLISDEALNALEAEKALASEQIENLKRLYREKMISSEQLEMAIRGIQKQLEEKIISLNI